MIENNFLFITNNVDRVQALTEQFAKDNNLEMFSFAMNKESIDAIHRIYTEFNNACIFISGLNKSNVADSLLKILENNKKNIYIFATGKEDISDALKSRFTLRAIRDKSYKEEIEQFIKGKTKLDKSVISDVSFYKQLATYTVNHYKDDTMYNLMLIADICNNFMLSTNNLNYTYEYMKLCSRYSRG